MKTICILVIVAWAFHVKEIIQFPGRLAVQVWCGTFPGQMRKHFVMRLIDGVCGDLLPSRLCSFLDYDKAIMQKHGMRCIK